MKSRPETGSGRASRRGGSHAPRRVAMSKRDMEILRSLADRIDPDDAGAHNNLGVVFYQKGLTEDAIRAFERALELDPRLDVARSNVEVAYLESGYFAKRVKSLRERIRRDPDDVAARDALARTFLLASRTDDAAREWASLLRDRPGSTAIHMKLAYARAEQGRMGEAIELVDRALELEPELPTLHLQRGELLHQAGDPAAALAAVRRSLELDRDSARAHLLLARILETQGREEASKEAWQRAERLNPSVAHEEDHLSLERYAGAGPAGAEADPAPVEAALGRLARAAEHRRAGDLDEAAAELERARVEEDSFEVRQALAEVRLLQGRPAEAAELYAALLEEQASSPKLWNEWGVALHRQGRMEEAVRAYRNAVARDHTYALGWSNLGVARAQIREPEPAERALRKAAEDAATPEILWNLGLFLNLHGDLDESVKVYATAVQQDRTVAESWNRLGGALFQVGRTDRARQALEQALELDPELAEARYQLGFVLSALGDFKGALRETQQALARESVLPAPRYQLLMDVQFERASVPAPETEPPERVATGEEIRSFEFEPDALDPAFAALEPPEPAEPAEPGAVAALLDAAESSLRRGRLGQAADAAARAVALAPTEPGPRLVQARVYLRQGLAGEALERFNEVLEHASERHAPEAAEGRVRALLALDRAPEAVPAAQQAVALGASPTLLGRALLRAGDADAAIGVFEGIDSLGPEATKDHADALLAAGRPADAEPLYRRVLADAPGGAARVGLARALRALGDRAGAEEAYADAVRALPSYGPAAVELAELRWRQGRHDEALRGLVSFLELDPNHVDGLVRLGTWLYETGRTDQAARALQRALRLAPDHARAASELERVRGGG